MADKKATLRKREVDDLRWLLGHAQGRRIAFRLLAQAGIFRSSFHTNGMTMAANEGRREAGLYWLQELEEAHPDAFVRLMQEHRDE